jgi:hypothetical protein
MPVELCAGLEYKNRLLTANKSDTKCLPREPRLESRRGLRDGTTYF